MEITINARHCTVPDSIRKQATQRMERMARFDRRLTGGTIVFDAEHNARRVEARLAIVGGPPLVGRGDSATLRAALDAALDRLERQVKRRRERRIARRTRMVRDLATS